MTKTVTVAAINNGTVIDHIASDQTLRILKMLGLLQRKRKVTVGFNLPSKRLQDKDLIKIEDHELTPEEANQIIVFAPNATINIIRNYKVLEKIKTKLPDSVSSVFCCPNQQCITNKENVKSQFYIEQMASLVRLVCRFCEKSYDRNEMDVHNAY